MSKIILTRGIQGSGKSTWAKKWVEEDPTHRVRWNNDDYRKMLGPYWIPERETIVSTGMVNFIYCAMTFGYDIVIDNINLNKKHWDFIQTQINNYNCDLFINDPDKRYYMEFKDFFDVPLEECIRRDSKRENPIGEKVITGTYNKYKDILTGEQHNE